MVDSLTRLLDSKCRRIHACLGSIRGSWFDWLLSRRSWLAEEQPCGEHDQGDGYGPAWDGIRKIEYFFQRAIQQRFFGRPFSYVEKRG